MPPAQDVSNALSRIRGVLNPKKEAERATRDIRLGLERIVRVLPHMQEWKGVHVGGTNGKGSICAFLSGLFTLAGVGYGRYVSPAFPDRHNAVTINGRYIDARVYETEARQVETAYQKAMRGWRLVASETPGSLSPFELETATAFHLFNKMRVPYGIVEVGMGGATDATNAMRRKAVTVISKIDLEHQEYLGRTIEEIAKVKAGIMRPGVPCIVDHTNSNAVIKVLRRHAADIGTTIQLSWKAEPFLKTLTQERWNLEDYQKQNLLCAALAFRNLFPYKEINLDKLLEMEPQLPGRMEWVGVSDLTDGAYRSPVLVDAAHNLSGVQALSRYADVNLRSSSDSDQSITWVMGLSSSKTKPFAEMLETLVRPQDNVAFVEYEQHPNEPPPTPAHIGRDLIQGILTNPEQQLYTGEPTVADAVRWAGTKANAAPGTMVITGSLYLIRDLYKLDGIYRSREIEDRGPGASQLWRLSKLWRRRPLSKNEYKDFQLAKSEWHRTDMGRSMKKIQDAAAEPSTTATAAETNADLVVDMAVKTDQQPPRPTFEAVKSLARKAKYHERQLRGYKAALRSISNDVEQQGGTDSEALVKLRQNVDLLRQQADMHHAALDRVTEQLCNHPDAPLQYALTHSEIYGQPSGRRDSPFLEPTELDELMEDSPAEEGEEKHDAGRLSEEQPEEDVSDVKKDFWGRPEGIDQVPEPQTNTKR
ncbi:dihydrofolate synthase [Geosmithia morbida]|uniref:Dihydrofolate synthase n=1 Tax=Geosmithia morbida TaxID=1094350 RepID=A0A9P4YQ97_9HYPO|nr:dihydrofolate synthase [Geosmithia morbida]KAF4120040.1 dihydrofolate synthase [Geosmithia morbida]